MGLRINSNINALIAIRHLGAAQTSQASAIERLSSGLRINRASDDPSGLVISNQLLGQLAGISQGIENSERALNTVQTGDSALGEVVDLLNEIRTSALAAIGSTPDIIAGEQAAVDAAVASIDRIASTTRFGERNLLNGQSSLRATAIGAGITDLRMNSIQFYGATSLDFDVNVTQVPTHAEVVLAAVPAGTYAEIEVAGSLGVDVITVPGGTTIADLETAINSVRANTGVYASGGAASVAYSEDFGSNAVCRLTDLGGPVTFTPGAATAGDDVIASVNGILGTGVGRELTIATPIFQGSILFATNVAAGARTVTVENSGLNLQLGAFAMGTDTYNVGFPNVRPELLGTPSYTIGTQTQGGFLDEVTSGGGNDLFTDPENAVRIVDAALEEVIAYRAHLGGTAAYNIQPGINSLQTQFVEVSDAVSNIQDTDYAIETANLLRSQILLEAGIAVLGQATLVPTSVLDLIRL